MKKLCAAFITIVLLTNCKDNINTISSEKIKSTTINKTKTESISLIPLQNISEHGAIAKEVDYKGRKAIQVIADPNHKSIEDGGCDNCTFVTLNNTNFRDGIIEIDVAGKPGKNASKFNRGFVGLVFRINDTQTNYEGFYLRPENSKSEERKNHSFQYFSAPDYPWHKLREKYPNKYEGYTNVTTGEWQNLKIEIKNNHASFYVNNIKVLNVDSLFQNTRTGKIGLFTEPNVDAYFSNLKIISSK